MASDVLVGLSAHRTAIRAAAGTLAANPAISRTSTVCRLTGAAGEARILVELGKAVAEKHDLLVSGELKGTVLTVHFNSRTGSTQAG